MADRLDELPDEPQEEEELEERKIYRSPAAEEAFQVRRENELFVVEGARVEKLVKMTNFQYR